VNLDQLSRMRCPYCRGGFDVAASLQEDGGALRYGTVECRCFRFPVLDGILLLGLTKGYGGAEEALQPYAPLQVAALTFLEQRDVPGLLAWIDDHAPLVGALLRSEGATYLELAAELHDATEAASRRYLAEQGRFGVVGTAAPGLRSKLRAVRSPGPSTTAPEALLDQLADFYVARFLSPRANSLAMLVAGLRPPRSVLSLCCGHGILETVLDAAEPSGPEVVSIDAQLLNLLVTRRNVGGRGTFICHDVQLPLPFADGAFDAVISSTCLPEIPSQAAFVEEATRVTHVEGWTLFDSIWNTELGVARIDPSRHYRYAQNFFARLGDYVPLFDEVVPAGREVAIDVGAAPADLAGAPRWAFDHRARSEVLRVRTDPELHVLVVGEGRRPFGGARRPWRSSALAANPVYDAAPEGDRLRLRRRPGFEVLLDHFAPTGFPGFRPEVDLAADPLDDAARQQHFLAGELVLLPPAFGAGHRLACPPSATTPTSERGHAADTP
jgi:SAM-dependent methyltransferase